MTEYLYFMIILNKGIVSVKDEEEYKDIVTYYSENITNYYFALSEGITFDFCFLILGLVYPVRKRRLYLTGLFSIIDG